MRRSAASANEKSTYTLFVCFFYFFLFRDPLESVSSVFGYADELIALLALPLFFLQLNASRFRLRIRRGGYTKYVVIFFLIGLVSSLVYGYQDFISIVLPDAFLCVKFWLSMYVGGKLFAALRTDLYAKKIFRHVKLITCLYLALFMADQAFNIFDSTVRYGIRSTQLMYSNQTTFVACCIFVTAVLLMISDYVKGYVKWLLLLLLLMCTSLRSKAFAAAFAIIIVCFIVLYRRKKFRLWTVLMFIPLAIALAWNQIQYYFFSSIQDDSARYQLLVKSVEVAKDHFPLGSGFGTFASYYSSVDYSQLYYIYGISDVNGLREGAANFVSDSFWPMIIAQSGFLGLAAFVLAIICLFMKIQRLKNLSAGYYAAALSLLVYLLIASSAESAFVHPVAIPLAVLLGFMLQQERKIQKSSGHCRKIHGISGHSRKRRHKLAKRFRYVFQDYFSPEDSFSKKLRALFKCFIWPSIPAEKVCRPVRLSLYYSQKNRKFLKQYYQRKVYKKYGCSISCDAHIGKGLFLPHPQNIVIGEGVVIGENVTIYHGVTLARKEVDSHEYPHIGDNVVIYCNSSVLGKVFVGDDAVIGAHSLVLEDVGGAQTAAGSPARIL